MEVMGALSKPSLENKVFRMLLKLPQVSGHPSLRRKGGQLAYSGLISRQGSGAFNCAEHSIIDTRT